MALEKQTFIFVRFLAFMIHANFVILIFKLLSLLMVSFNVVEYYHIKDNFLYVDKYQVIIINRLIIKFEVHEPLYQVVYSPSSK